MKSTFITFVLLLAGAFGSPLISKRERRDANVKVIKGSTATIGKFPMDVSFLVENNIWGAGVIINQQWILTTAFNCLWVDPSFITVRVGSSYWAKSGKLIQASTCIMHPNYTGTYDYDIALLKLSTNITYGSNIKAATLPSASASAGKSYTFTGWGVSTTNYTKAAQLHKVTQTVWNTTQCSTAYNLTDTNFCAYNANGGPCVFDFGGPLSTNRVVYGLYQGSTDCTNPATYPTLYTDVYYFTTWIQETIQNYTSSAA